MSATKEGGLKAAVTNKKLYGADFYARIGAMGGSKEVRKGFATNRKLASEAGRKGGMVTGNQYKTRSK